MRLHKKTALTFLLFVLHGTTYTQQERIVDSASQWSGHCSISITSNIARAIVLINGKPAGFTPCSIDTLLAGKYHIRIFHPDIQSWLTGMFDDTLALKSGEVKTVSYTFRPRFTLTTEPFGAIVTMKDSTIGTTPLAIEIPAEPSVVHVSKSGFATASVPFSDVHRTLLSIPLKEAGGSQMLENTVINSQPRWPLYATGAGSIITGALAAYFKVKADNAFADYRTTGDPALLSKTNRLDTGAAIALIVTQIQLGLFTFFILSE